MADETSKEAVKTPAAPLKGAARMNVLEAGLKTLQGQVSDLVSVVGDLANGLKEQRSFPQAPAGSPLPPIAVTTMPVQTNPVATPPGMQWEKNSGVQGHTPTFVDPSYKAQLIPVEPPTDYLRVRDSILNTDFPMEVLQFSDRPQVQVHIIVPDKYSNVPPDQRHTKSEDRRSKVINTAAAVPELAEWMNKIRLDIAQGQRAAARPTPVDLVR